MNGLSNLPPRLLNSSIRSLTTFIGIAKPMFCPCEAMAVFTPMTCPFELSRGPPELPGFIAASVWITLSNRSTKPSNGDPAVIPLPSPEITPTVTVFLNSPKGVPIAMAVCPSLS